MNVAYLTANTTKQRLYVVATANVTTELSEQQLAKAYNELREKMENVDD